MRKSLLFIAFLLVIILVAGVATAQTGIPGSGWWSGEQVQNVSNSEITVVIEAFDSLSSNTYMETKNIGPGAAYTFTPFSDFASMPAGFVGSAVVSANGPIKAIVNVTNQQSGSIGVAGGKAAAQNQGTASETVATTLYFPLAKGDFYGKTTSFYIQNAGSSTATNVTAVFTMNGADFSYDVPDIGASQMAVISVFDAPSFNPPTRDDRLGSLVVTGDQPLAGVVMEHDTTSNPATVLQGTRAFTSSDFDTKAFAPVTKNSAFGRFTGVQVQNTSGGSINIDVDYAGTYGSCLGQTYKDSFTGLADGNSATFVQLPGSTNLPSNCIASATISATGDFVAIVNEAETSGSPKAGITYYALPTGSTTTELSIPLFKDNFYGLTTGLQIQNVGSSAASNWTATFNCTTQSNTTFTAVSDPAKTGAIAAGSAYLFYLPSTTDVFTAGNPFASSKALCAVSVTSDEPIVAIANETALSTGSLDDNNYEGFNLAP